MSQDKIINGKFEFLMLSHNLIINVLWVLFFFLGGGGLKKTNVFNLLEERLNIKILHKKAGNMMMAEITEAHLSLYGLKGRRVEAGELKVHITLILVQQLLQYPENRNENFTVRSQ